MSISNSLRNVSESVLNYDTIIIIGYLDFFIRQRKGRKIYKNAIEKWEKDKEFVESYRKGSFRMVGIGSITRK